MNRIRRLASGKTPLVLAILLGVVTTAGTLAWLGSQRGDAAPVEVVEVERRTVVQLRRDVPAGVTLSSAMLAEQEVPADVALEQAFATSDEVVGRTTRYPLVRGEQITPGKLVGAEESAEEGLAFSVPPGMRGVSVPVSEVSGAGGLIVPGDRVDVLVSTSYDRLFTPAELKQQDDIERTPIVLTVLQDVLVLAVGQEFTPPADQGRDPATLRTEDAEAQPRAASVTLAVSPEEAQALFMAAHEGKLGLALRSFGDKSKQILEPLLKIVPADETFTVLNAPR
jgi:pilus assembly protein CpaB